jgi:DNA modification methylase
MLSIKAKDLISIPQLVALALQADGWWLRSDIIWAKKNPMPESVTDRPTKAHEHVFLLTKAQRYFYDAGAIKERALQPFGEARFVAQHKQAALGANQTGTLGTHSGAEFRNNRTVWTIATEPCDLAHFALMPTELARRCILAGCPKGGVVLDPFGGGGTTGLVAARHGRRAILCELNPEYAEIARQRIAREWREPVKPTVDPNIGPLFAEAAE